MQLAQRAGVARTTVDGWKTNPRAPLVTTVTEVADRLGIERQEALRLAGLSPPHPPAAESDQEESPTDRLERLWREYRDDPGERGTVLRGLLWSWLEESEAARPSGREGSGEQGEKSDTA